MCLDVNNSYTVYITAGTVLREKLHMFLIFCDIK